MLTPTDVLLADDHPVVLAGLSALIGLCDDFQVVSTCDNGQDALRVIRETRPTIACLDVRMPGLSGLEVLRAVRHDGIATKIVLLTASASLTEVAEAQQEGAEAVLRKDVAADELVDCLREIRANLPASRQQAGPTRGLAQASQARLTPREREITSLVVKGLSNKHIARQAHISEGTVKIHLYNIYQKLGVKNRTSLANCAAQLTDRSAPENDRRQRAR